MHVARSAFWAVMALGFGPELIGFAKAEAHTASATVAEAIQPSVTSNVTPEAASSQPAGPAAVALPAQPPRPAKPAITLSAKVDLARQTLTVTERGKTVGVWKISSGASAEFATPRGTFKPEWTAKLWHSKKYDDAPMPHAVFFKDGAAIHATQAVGRLGTPASHGCVRLAPANAATFYALVQRHGMSHTEIKVFGDAPYPRMIAKAAPKPVGMPTYSQAGSGYGYRVSQGQAQYAWSSNSWFGSPAPNRMPTYPARYRY